MVASKRCKICVAEGLTTRRKIKARGMCHTHLRAASQVSRQARREKHVADTYGITEDQYQAIYVAQGRKCAICRRATGTGKYRLAVDHDHALAKLHDHPEDKGCPDCIRGLLCRRCNRGVLGHLHDEPEALERGADYLRNPPAQAVLRGHKNG